MHTPSRRRTAAREYGIGALIGATYTLALYGGFVLAQALGVVPQ